MISFGYGIDGNKICVIDSEAQIVKEIFEKYSAGKLLQEIADELSNRRIDFFKGIAVGTKIKSQELLKIKNILAMMAIRQSYPGSCFRLHII